MKPSGMSEQDKEDASDDEEPWISTSVKIIKLRADYMNMRKKRILPADDMKGSKSKKNMNTKNRTFFK